MPLDHPDKKPAKIILREIVDKVYQDAWEAKKRGEPVGWSSSKFPAEIPETLRLAVCYPENQAAAISAKHGGQRMCEHAESLGYAGDICGYARISLAYAAGAESQERPMPQPDFLLCCNNICNCMTKCNENIARMHNIPLIMIDVPFNNSPEVSDETVAYLKGQFMDAVRQLEKSAGVNGMKRGSRKCAKTPTGLPTPGLKPVLIAGISPPP
jgi:benzoyl-CoA reductase/2-hydroxyglutaryl-CoA dehydratase subunit BcrC/BadD/HgdB